MEACRFWVLLGKDVAAEQGLAQALTPHGRPAPAPHTSTARDAVQTCRRLTEYHRYVPIVEWPAHKFSPPYNLVPALRDLPCNHTNPRRRALGRRRARAAAHNGCPWRCVARLGTKGSMAGWAIGR